MSVKHSGMIDAGSSSDLAFDRGLESSSTTSVDSDQAIAMEEHDRKTKGAHTQIRTREPPTSIQEAEDTPSEESAHDEAQDAAYSHSPLGPELSYNREEVVSYLTECFLHSLELFVNEVEERLGDGSETFKTSMVEESEAIRAASRLFADFGVNDCMRSVHVYARQLVVIGTVLEKILEKSGSIIPLGEFFGLVFERYPDLFPHSGIISHLRVSRRTLFLEADGQEVDGKGAACGSGITYFKSDGTSFNGAAKESTVLTHIITDISLGPELQVVLFIQSMAKFNEFVAKDYTTKSLRGVGLIVTGSGQPDHWTNWFMATMALKAAEQGRHILVYTLNDGNLEGLTLSVLLALGTRHFANEIAGRGVGVEYLIHIGAKVSQFVKVGLRDHLTDLTESDKMKLRDLLKLPVLPYGLR